jgi:hypothetical protein
MDSLEDDNLVIFYYLSASEIWPDKWSLVRGLIRGVVFDGSCLIRGGLMWERPDKRGGL